MRIAVINEFSTKNRNGDVLKALEELGYEPVNLGMKDLEGEPQAELSGDGIFIGTGTESKGG